MKKRFLSLLLAIGVMCTALAACSGGNSSSSSEESSSGSETIEEVDYVSQVKLDFDADSLTQEVTVKSYIDGDTTHFYAPKDADLPGSILEYGYMKTRYMAVDTPESTGAIEPWGKAAKNFTNEKLKSAESIVLETDANKWEIDGNGRYLVWVWYKPQGAAEYRNLNLELLQNGLAIGSKIATTRYEAYCTKAIAQAKALSLYVYSKEKDPDYYYGTAVELDLKELRLNIEKYNGIRVAFEATVAIWETNTAYVQEYDAETGIYFGIQVFAGMSVTSDVHAKLNTVGNRVRIVGEVSYYDDGGYYQVTDLKYNKMKPKDADNTQLLSQGEKIAYPETTIATFRGNKTVDVETVNPDTEEVTVETKTFKYAELTMFTTLSMKNLNVTHVKTTQNGDNKGAMTLTCEADGQTITVRTEVIYNLDGTLVTEAQLLGKTIDVRGNVTTFDGEYQVHIYSFGNLTIH